MKSEYLVIDECGYLFLFSQEQVKSDQSAVEQLWISVEMASKNSSLRKDETAVKYLEKVAKRYQVDVDSVVAAVKKYVDIDERELKAKLGRASHNITYLDGPLSVTCEDGVVTNRYRKLGVGRLFVRYTKVDS